MFSTKLFLVCVLIVAIIEYGNAAFQCYKCNNCGTTWNPNKATLVLTEAGSNYCTKRVVGTTVTKDYSPTCTAGNGLYCCQDDICNSSNSKYHINMAIFVLFSVIGFLMRLI